jgi:tetratricopeptide (TPR) repeat protein
MLGVRKDLLGESARFAEQPAPLRAGARVLVLLPMAILAGCGTEAALRGMLGDKHVAIVENTSPAPALRPEPTKSASERLQLAIGLLQQGDPARARLELTIYLAQVPDSRPARTLLAQIDTPLTTLFPAESFTVQLGRNETLSSLAELYLGDAYRWYGLARYNGIQNPAKVLAGQTIRIPKTAQSVAALARLSQARARPQPAPAAPAANTPKAALPTPPRGADLWASIREDVAAGRFDSAIREAESNRVTPDRAQSLVLASAYLGNARTLRGSDPKSASAQAMRAAQLYLENADRAEDAVDALQLAVEINPTDAPAKTLLASTAGKAAESYYRTGVAAFQRQDLDKAIAAWDRALAIDPTHRNAQLSRAQALELKQNLKELR